MRQEARVQALSGSPLFAGCSKQQLKALARLTRVVRVDKGDTLISAGAPSTDAYLVTAGTAEVKKKGGKAVALGPGDVVGELGLLLGKPRNATVVATSSLECLALGRGDLQAAVETSGQLGWVLLQAVASRLDG